MLNNIGTEGNQGIFIEGESDIIDEDDEGNHSFDNIRRSSRAQTKRNKSLDDFDGENNEAPVNQQDFLRDLMNENRQSLKKNEGQSYIRNRVPPIKDPNN